MYFSDAYQNLTQDEIRSFKATERRLMLRLFAIGSLSLAILGIALI
jgi:hypothetical protein